MQIIFTASGEFGLPSLRGLLDSGHEIAAVYTQPDRPAGRGRKLTPTPIAQFALDQNLNLVRRPDLNRESLPPADLMIVIAFGQKIAPSAVDHPRLGSINLHGSLLPKLRGAAPVNWAILRGDSETGNSIIRLAPRMDAGNILAQSRLPIGETETAGELHDRLAEDGARLVQQVIEQFESGTIQETPQVESEATIAPKLNRRSAVIDWKMPAIEIARQIRGLYPWPGCRVGLQDAAGAQCARLTLVRAKVVETEGPRWHPGEIMIHGDIACSDHAIQIIEVQPEGKRPMPLADYRRGNSWMPGMRLQSI